MLLKPPFFLRSVPVAWLLAGAGACAPAPPPPAVSDPVPVVQTLAEAFEPLRCREVAGVVRSTMAGFPPLPGVSVEIVGLRARTVTDQEGRFHFGPRDLAQLSPGEHGIQIERPGVPADRIAFVHDLERATGVQILLPPSPAEREGDATERQNGVQGAQYTVQPLNNCIPLAQAQPPVREDDGSLRSSRPEYRLQSQQEVGGYLGAEIVLTFENRTRQRVWIETVPRGQQPYFRLEKWMGDGWVNAYDYAIQLAGPRPPIVVESRETATVSIRIMHGRSPQNYPRFSVQPIAGTYRVVLHIHRAWAGPYEDVTTEYLVPYPMRVSDPFEILVQQELSF